MDSQKAANWAQIIGTCMGAVLLGYEVWDHWPAPNQPSVGVGWGGIMKGYVPPALIALTLLASSILQIVLWRRRHRKATRANDTKPSLEILSPFDNEEVGLYEIVRGRVFPPNSNLQVLVFAGDGKWYPQPHVDVNGSTWSVKCQFGRLESPDSGAYKIVAVLGNAFREGMWYGELPITTPKSNIITVYRPDITIEQKLSAALKDAQEAHELAHELDRELDEAKREWRDWERKYHKVNNEKIPVETERDNYKNQIAELKRDLAATEGGHELVVTTERIEKNMLKEDLENTKRELKNAYLKVNEETNQRDQFMKLYYGLESKLADLKWLEDRMNEQGEGLSDWVRIKKVTPVNMQLTATPRMIVLAFWVTNDSVFDVTLNLKNMTGCLHFKNRPRREPRYDPCSEQPNRSLKA